MTGNIGGNQPSWDVIALCFVMGVLMYVVPWALAKRRVWAARRHKAATKQLLHEWFGEHNDEMLP